MPSWRCWTYCHLREPLAVWKHFLVKWRLLTFNYGDVVTTWCQDLRMLPHLKVTELSVYFTWQIQVDLAWLIVAHSQATLRFYFETTQIWWRLDRCVSTKWLYNCWSRYEASTMAMQFGAELIHWYSVYWGRTATSLQHGYTGLTWSQLWPMAITFATGACWDTVARYPLLCVNVITALRVTWYLSPACSSGFLFVQQWCFHFQDGLVTFPSRETLQFFMRVFHGFHWTRNKQWLGRSVKSWCLFPCITISLGDGMHNSLCGRGYRELDA